MPNGEYAMIVDFGEDHYTQGCEAEGVLCHDMMSGSGTGGSGCTSVGTVTVSDGRFTATGYSHDTGLCHSISMVQLRTAIQLGDPNVVISLQKRRVAVSVSSTTRCSVF